jgi:two-component system, chemotaxis family, protein-glutamate methylesterase/glutaminase
MHQLTKDIIVIGASAGGVEALQRLVSTLPRDLPAAVFVVLHIGTDAVSYLPDILARAGALPVVHARTRTAIEYGRIYVAPVDVHLVLEPDSVLLVRGPRENRFRPAINPLFRSAAVAFRQRAVGVILSGMLDDGTAGLWAIKECGGTTIVQSDAAFSQMPTSALENVRIDHAVPLNEIAALLTRLSREGVNQTPVSIPAIVQHHNDQAKMEGVNMAINSLGERVPFSCPECNGALWRVREGRQERYSCHVGHAYSADVLNAAQEEKVEEALWSAVRALKENASLNERLATLSAATAADTAESFRSRSMGAIALATQLQEFLKARTPG